MNLNKKIKITLLFLLIVLIAIFLYFYNFAFNLNKKNTFNKNVTKEVIKASILNDSHLIKKTIKSKEAYSLSNLDNSLKFLLPLNFINLNLEKIIYEDNSSAFHINYSLSDFNLENYYFNMISDFTQRNWKMINSKRTNNLAFIEAENNNYQVSLTIETAENNLIKGEIYILNK